MCCFEAFVFKYSLTKMKEKIIMNEQVSELTYC